MALENGFVASHPKVAAHTKIKENAHVNNLYINVHSSKQTKGGNSSHVCPSTEEK